jgi:hypothetical protein
MTEQRYKEIMSVLPWPNSVSICQALKQVANEVAQEWEAKLIATEQRAFTEGRCAQARLELAARDKAFEELQIVLAFDLTK